MRKILLTASAVAVLGFATPLFAEDAANPADPNAMAPAMTAPAATGTTVATAPSVLPKFLDQQQTGQWLASNLIGSTVYGPGDENLGDVNDIVLAQDGTPYALVIGVGGFLGIGEKNVAVPFSSVTNTTDADGKLKLTLNTTKEELDAAPAFVTTAMLLQEQQDKLLQDNAAQPAAPAPAPAN